MFYQEQLVGRKSRFLTDLIVVTFLQRLEQESTTTSDIRPTKAEYESSWWIHSQLFFLKTCSKSSGYTTSQPVLARERKNEYGDYLVEEEFRLCLEAEERMRLEHEKNIIEEQRFRVNEAKRMKLEEEKLLEISKLKKRRQEFMNSTHVKSILGKLTHTKGNHIDSMPKKTKSTVSWVKINKHRLNANDPSLAELLKKVKPWVEDLLRSVGSRLTLHNTNQSRIKN
ncbi:hypothetical protein Tco_0178262 [Tanacetum coccineum]